MVESRVIGRVLSIGILALVVAGCGGSERSGQPERGSEGASAEDIQRFTPPSAEQAGPWPEGVDTLWSNRVGEWPRVVEGATDSNGLFIHDGLSMRFDLNLGQNFDDSLFPGGPPLLALLSVTIIPVVDYADVRDFRLDTLSVHNPLTDRDLPPLVILQSERALKDREMFFRLSTKVMDLYVPDSLVEGQPLETRVLMTMARRRWLIALPPTRVAFVQPV